MLAVMLAPCLRQDDERPIDDGLVVLRGASWADFQRLLEIRDDVSVPRIAYVGGALQIMTPSRPHESLKSTIGRLVEVWCLEHGIEFSAYGSWTLEKKDASCGIEPDECYVFGTVASPERPDLAIEVMWTSGGIDELEIYRRLGVREVWIWRRGKLTAHQLQQDSYIECNDSAVLPELRLDDLAGYLDRPTVSQAIREYRDFIGARRSG